MGEVKRQEKRIVGYRSGIKDKEQTYACGVCENLPTLNQSWEEVREIPRPKHARCCVCQAHWGDSNTGWTEKRVDSQFHVLVRTKNNTHVSLLDCLFHDLGIKDPQTWWKDNKAKYPFVGEDVHLFPSQDPAEIPTPVVNFYKWHRLYKLVTQTRNTRQLHLVSDENMRLKDENKSLDERLEANLEQTMIKNREHAEYRRHKESELKDLRTEVVALAKRIDMALGVEDDALGMLKDPM